MTSRASDLPPGRGPGIPRLAEALFNPLPLVPITSDFRTWFPFTFCSLGLGSGSEGEEERQEQETRFLLNLFCLGDVSPSRGAGPS